jgi:hypothetical protein
MARATAHPDHQCISSEDIHGTTVYSPDGKNIGEIDHPHHRQAVGTRGLRRDEFRRFHGPRPQSLSDSLGALTYDKSLGGFRTNITENQLRDAPEFSDDSGRIAIGRFARIVTTASRNTGRREACSPAPAQA